MKKTLITLLLSLFCLIANGTGQVHDKVIIKGERWEMPASPLLSLPEEAYKDFRELLGRRNYVSSANQKGYVAYWCIEKRSLYLDKVEVPLPNGKMMEINMDLIEDALKEYMHKDRIRVEWMKGRTTTIGRGSGPVDRRNPYAPSFEETRTLTFKKFKVRIR